MKKIYMIIALFGLLCASCSMDKYPYDAMPSDKYFTDFNQYKTARNGIYAHFRGLTTGSTRLVPEMMSNSFNSKWGYNNAYMNPHEWNVQISFGPASGFWSAYYGTISDCNFFLDMGYAKFQAERESENGSEFKENEEKLLDVYAGEAYFCRAYSYFFLAQYFCRAYDEAIADTPHSGVPLVTKYGPTTDQKKYPDRASMKETYDLIISDLEKAEELITTQNKAYESGKPNYYISDDAVHALKARVYLSMKEYEQAAKYAKLVIQTGKYPLARIVKGQYTKELAGQFLRMWVCDDSPEAIWQIAMNDQEKGASDGNIFLGVRSLDQVDYLPSADLVDLYMKNTNLEQNKLDFRLLVYFNYLRNKQPIEVSSGCSGNVLLFEKFGGSRWGLETKVPGSGDYPYVHESQVFRSAEMFLIAAEAEANLGHWDEANNYLNRLEQTRILGVKKHNFANLDSFMKELKDERKREMVGEGLTLLDLKRWKDGVFGRRPQQDDLVNLPGSERTTNLVVEPSDHRFVWPIPEREMDVNPNLKNQQNKGY